MPKITNVPAKLALALETYSDQTALTDGALSLRYGQLADAINKIGVHLPTNIPVAVFGKPSTVFGAAVTACVVLGRPFVHLDPAMPNDVLANIIRELEITVILTSDQPSQGQIPDFCDCISVTEILTGIESKPSTPVVARKVRPDDIIYIVATSGTTGKPKCIPVTQQSAFLSYEWRDAYTPYDTHQMVGVYIFAIWEMFRPLRNGASVCFPKFNELMNPHALLGFWQRYGVTEMLFTPSALEKTLQALPTELAKDVSLQRIILNGEVVSDDLIAAVNEKLPQTELWNLYSICETHDVSMTNVTTKTSQSGAVSVGVPMRHLKAVVLDQRDQICPVGQPGLLHFEGPQMLGPGYVNRPEETALRFRNLDVAGENVRLYDTGDQGYVGDDGEVYVIGRIAHMLKLRGHSIQIGDLMDSLRKFISFGQAIPWIQDVDVQGNSLVFYYQCDPEQAAQNREKWGLEIGENRMPAALAAILRKELPPYCIPSYMVHLNEIPINAVSGKCDFKRLPKLAGKHKDDTVKEGTLPTLALASELLGCADSELDPALSFHDQGGDSLMAVNLLLALEDAYARRVDFDFALNVSLGRLHDVLTTDLVAPAVRSEFDRKGILLTGVTGFLGSRVLAALARSLPKDQVIYCVIREKRKTPTDRLKTIAAQQGVDPDRLVLIPAAIEDGMFGLDSDSYRALTHCVTSVIHCAAMVNLAVDQTHMEAWSQAGITNTLQFCRDAGADLRFSSSSAVFPDVGGPNKEQATSLFEGCSGYGAAKIDAENQIAKSGVTAAIVRLPSLYDLGAPNPNDIYEIILAACAQMKAIPEGFSFRMIDVHAAADCLAGLTPETGTRYLNLVPDVFVAPELFPKDITVLPLSDWLTSAPLSDAERALISADTSVLRAMSTFECSTAQATWNTVAEAPFETISAPVELLTRRFPKAAVETA